MCKTAIQKKDIYQHFFNILANENKFLYMELRGCFLGLKIWFTWGSILGWWGVLYKGVLLGCY